MAEREDYYEDFIKNLVDKYYHVEVDLTKDTEASLPKIRIDMLFEIPKKILKEVEWSPLPFVEEVNLVHIKAINDKLTKDDFDQYLA